MKLAFVSQPWNRVLPTHLSGSVPIWTHHVATRLSQWCEVVVYANKFPGDVQNETYEGVEYRRIHAPADHTTNRLVEPLTKLRGRKHPFMASPLFYRSYYARVAADLRESGADIVHIHSFPQHARQIKALNPNIRTVVHLHTEWLNRLDLRKMTQQSEFVDCYLGCSDYLSDKHFQAIGGPRERFQTVFNAVDTQKFSESDATNENASQTGPQLLFVGRVSPEKGIHILLKAFDKVLETEPEAHLTILGPNWAAPLETIIDCCESDYVSELRRFYDTNAVSSLASRIRSRYPRRLHFLPDTTYFGRLRQMVRGRLDQRVDFPGPIPHSDLVPYYQKADLVILPSLYETFGIPLIESMACATPVIATKVGGIPEVVQDRQTGVLVDPNDPAALGNAIIEYLRETPPNKQSMAEAARRRACSLFSFECAAARLSECYRKLI